MVWDRQNNTIINQDSSSDKGYTSPPPAVSLPKGGGAIKGIGEKFSVNPVTGTGSLSVPLFTTPSRSDFYPQLSLSYDSGAGNGAFGLGWNLSVPSITRKTDKGLPKYRDAEDSDVFILSGAEDLVPSLIRRGDKWIKDERSLGEYTVRRYQPRIEGLFARIERWQHRTTGDIHWRSLSQDNVTSIYGRYQQKLADEGNEKTQYNGRIVASEEPSHVFQWLLEASYDNKGNLIIYEYKQEDTAGVAPSLPQEKNRLANSKSYTHRYLKRIKYGNTKTYKAKPGEEDYTKLFFSKERDKDWLFQVVFDYGEHHRDKPTPYAEVQPWVHRADAFSNFRAGFEIRTQRLCQRVLMFHNFEELDKNWCLVRSTDFGYPHSENPTRKNPIVTYLTSVTQTGYVKDAEKGYLKKSLPPLEFHYDRPEIHGEIQSLDSESLENLPMGLDGSQYQWIDLDSEGISGILTEQGNGWFYKRNLGEAEFGPLELVATKPSLANLQSPQQRVMDLAGDGTQDLVLLGTQTGYYQREQTDGWQQFIPFVSSPNINWQDPNLRFIDLNGDGHADILISENEVFVWYPSQAREGFGASETVRKSQDEEEGPALVFADGTQSVYLADMSGDGLNDLVRIRNGKVCYWPSLGYGRFGAKVTMDGAPYFDHPEMFDQKRVRLADIDGSGTTDILYLGRGAIAVWFNQAGNSWSEPTYLTNFPTIDNLASVQVVDLLGNGTACIVWSSPLPGQAHQPMQYIDLMGGQKPHLMTSVVNNLGAETKLKYVSSTHFYLKDRKEGNQWITRLPFPVHVVERVETCDRITGNRFVTTYRYRHGYFDGQEREFRGFGYVEQKDTEEYEQFKDGGGTNLLDRELHVPPVLTKTWFHTGAFIDREHISNYFAEKEYYRESRHQVDPNTSEADRRQKEKEFQTTLLPDTYLPSGVTAKSKNIDGGEETVKIIFLEQSLTAREEWEACRALKGSILRQEIYALDESDRSEHPYSVSERNYELKWLQPRQGSQYAVFFAHPRETIDYHYERNPADPRISHQMMLEVDRFGNVKQSAAIAYPRREAQAGSSVKLYPEQKQLSIAYTEAEFTNSIDTDDNYRTPLPWETRTYELTGKLKQIDNRFTISQLLEISQQAKSLDYEKIADESGIVKDENIVDKTKLQKR